jgi:hypothetical protein
MAESIGSSVRYNIRRGSFSGVAFAVFDRRYGNRRHKTWIDIAEAAIAGDDVRCALLGGAKFAIPHHVAGAKVLHRAPRRIAEAAGVSGANA